MATSSHLPLSNPKNDGDIEKERVGEIISSLPKAKGWFTHYLYQYEGFWYMYASLEATILAQHNFKFQQGDIFVATNPKCGTTWIKALVYAIMNQATYKNQSVCEGVTHPLLSNNPHALVPNIESPLFQKFASERIETMPLPRLFGTHMPYNSVSESVNKLGCRVVYMCRDPKDMFVSMWHFFKKIKVTETPLISLQEAFDLFCDGISYMGPYWDHVLGYYKASLEWPERVHFLKYEDMQTDTAYYVDRLAKFLGYPFSSEEKAEGAIPEIIQLFSFEKMSSLEVTTNSKLFGQVNNDIFYRKGAVGDSKNYLTIEMMERLNQITEKKFRGCDIGY